MSRRDSVTSQHSNGGVFVLDGGARMADLFASIAGTLTTNRTGDNTIRAAASSTCQPLAPVATGSSTTHPRGPAPHQTQTQAEPNPAANDLTRAQQDFLAAKLQLEQAKLVSQTAKLINNWWNNEKHLAANGTNLARWLNELMEIGSAHMLNGEFFFKPITNLTFEKIARMAALEGVHGSLVSDLQRANSALEMLSLLKKRFSVVLRAAQMNVFNWFLNFSVDKSESAGLSSLMRNLYTEWNNLNVRIHSDAFFGFMFQRAVMNSLVPFKKDFEQRIENAMQNNDSKSCPKFDLHVNTFDVCKKQHADLTTLDTTLTNSSAPSVLFAASDGDEFDFDAFLADIPEANWPDALDFYAATAHRCWQCGAPNHYLQDCP
ncbi:hypothetical protein PTTG_26869 [Puccinia triticina 1-1 BBBD Race 1]|uniref:CCHC-type domain-containing protein n=1 Tax=Puccinia triticina (isolate 1-1 / race 1 (BBBD)) TaxID=630390 RepID=A0A180GPK7_PUCT1|nr:hypothetical protein PTTG_26869 [Puccinia triticina 1-1 BBBD Race 1]